MRGDEVMSLPGASQWTCPRGCLLGGWLMVFHMRSTPPASFSPFRSSRFCACIFCLATLPTVSAGMAAVREALQKAAGRLLGPKPAKTVSAEPGRSATRSQSQQQVQARHPVGNTPSSSRHLQAINRSLHVLIEWASVPGRAPRPLWSA